MKINITILFVVAWLQLQISAQQSDSPVCFYVNVNDEIEQIEAKFKRIEEKVDPIFKNYGTYDANGMPVVYNLFFNTLTYHEVFVDKTISARIRFVRATVKYDDKNCGSEVSKEMRQHIHAYHKVCGADETGHIIGSEFGGTGAKIHNLFPQNSNLNRGIWKSSTTEVKAHLNLDINENPKRRSVQMKYGFIYADSTNRMRPSGIVYKFKLFDGISSTPLKTFVGYVENGDYWEFELIRCTKDDVTLLHPYKSNTDLFDGLKTCKVEQDFNFLYSPGVADDF